MAERECLGHVSVGNIVGTTRVEDSLLAIAIYVIRSTKKMEDVKKEGERQIFARKERGCSNLQCNIEVREKQPEFTNESKPVQTTFAA